VSGPYFPDLPDVIVGQKQTLAFDFGKFLPSGVTLTGTPTVTIAVSDLNGQTAPVTLDSEFTGAAQVGTVTLANGGSAVANAAVLRQMLPTVGGGITYCITITATRSDGDIAKGESHIRVVTPG
jgi:hypothetical protein